jgi:hypothetical protein
MLLVAKVFVANRAITDFLGVGYPRMKKDREQNENRQA